MKSTEKLVYPELGDYYSPILPNSLLASRLPKFSSKAKLHIFQNIDTTKNSTEPNYAKNLIPKNFTKTAYVFACWLSTSLA